MSLNYERAGTDLEDPTLSTGELGVKHCWMKVCWRKKRLIYVKFLLQLPFPLLNG